MILREKIGLKLTVAVCLTALVTIGIFAAFNSRAQSRSLLAEVERHADQLSEAVKASTEYDMLLNQRDRIYDTIRRLGTRENIQRIRVMNKTGAVIYSSDRSEIGRMVDKKAESCTLCHSADRPLERLETKERTRVFRPRPGSPRTLGIINPIYNAPACWNAACHAHPREQVVLGVLDVNMSLAEVDRDIRRGELGILVFALGAILALSAILGLLVKRWVDAPVRALLEGTRRVASGDLEGAIPEGGDDELGMLAQSFNNMTRRLSEARLQLFQSDKLASLGRLAAGIAHEINNPLTGVLTYSSFLLKRAQDQPELRQDLEVIVRETIRSREIVKSLLDFARQSVPKRAEADINEILERSAAVVANQLALNQVRLVKDLAPGLPKVTVDANQLQQVFINLFVNAADAIGPKGGAISVSSTVISLSPIGITQIKKAACPKRHSLIDEGVRIDGRPAVRIRVRSEKAEGFLYLNPMYGMGGHHHAVAPEAGPGARFVCPECSTSLLADKKVCPDCGSPVYAFEVPTRGLVEGCTKPGCGWQRWDEVDGMDRKEFVELKVRDDGCGMPQEVLSRIFEPFYSTKGQKGTGLGLAMVWGIMDNHNGTISVESAPGSGTVFTLRIPVKP
ncbi:MAG: HAMP domain-containing protein [Elusimicrobia bacterium]|nr:HAMP domain-containing protein [Elusimicrobiota bacterium]